MVRFATVTTWGSHPGARKNNNKCIQNYLKTRSLKVCLYKIEYFSHNYFPIDSINRIV